MPLCLKIAGNEFPLQPGTNRLGRTSANEIVIIHPKVSSRHLVIHVENDLVVLEDLESTNGVYVNSQRITKQPITVDQPFFVADLEAIIVNTTETGNTPDMQDLKRQVHAKLLQSMNLKKLDLKAMGDEDLGRKVRDKIEQAVKEITADRLSGVDKPALARQVFQDALGLGPIEDLIDDPGITEIMVNHAGQIYVERGGRIVKSDRRFSSNEQVMDVIERIVAPLGRRIDESSPMVDARLKDGSRVNAIIPPLALSGPCLTIRKFSKKKLMPADLLQFESATEPMLSFLELAVRSRKNIVISGGTGSGKTTLLNILASYIPEDERIVTIEDSAELRLPQEHVVSLESRPPNIEGTGAVTIRDLVRNALRMRPDRIVVGECRGGEALDMLQAMNTGHDGSLTTAHANAPRDALARLETMCLMSGTELPFRAIRDQVCSALDLIVQQSRMPDGSRKITHITEIAGMQGESIQSRDLFGYRQKGMDSRGKVRGEYYATGEIPAFVEELQEQGLTIDLAMFNAEAKG